MSNNSDRAYFLEALKSEALTINQIVERFGVAINTARNWANHAEVEKIEGSWPPAYMRKDAGLIPVGKSTKPNIPHDPVRGGRISIEIDVPPQTEVHEFFESIMHGDGGVIDFKPEFRKAESQHEIRYLVHKLKSAIVVSEYYLSLMKKEGMP